MAKKSKSKAKASSRKRCKYICACGGKKASWSKCRPRRK